MPTTRLTLAYDGAGFAGWARQPGHRTVQGCLEGALERLRGGRPAPVTVAGRTDAGVHAWGQVASYDGEPVVLRGLDALLPGDLAVTACEAAPEGFSARHDARSRTYCFRVHAAPARDPFERGRSLWWPHPVDRGALDACAAALRGEHDFTAFTPTATDHVRFRRVVLDARWEVEAAGGPAAGRVADGVVLRFWIEADAFMRQMNRVLVGTMLEVAGGRRDPDGFAALLAGAPRAAAGPTAPPHGLYLAGVRYSGAAG